MKQAILESIKQLDTTRGGGFSGRVARVDMVEHPVLVIGLGGTGTDALLRLKHQAQRRFANLNDIEFLSLETNEHEKKRYRGTTLDQYTEQVLLSNAGIGAILNSRAAMPKYISDWLDPRLTITDGTKGASGNRQAGRLLLFEKIHTAVDAIDNKIRRLRTGHQNKLLVYILSGTSGGTGGGMFLDAAYIVRGLVEREFGAKGVDKVDITGYLFTPDIHLAGNNMNIHTEQYIRRNGYAALKELDWWMGIEERDERFTQTYGTRLNVDSPLPPFNLCHLVSAVNTEGVYLQDAYDYCMNVTAENIVNFLALEEKESGIEFAIADYHSNLTANIAAMRSSMDAVPGRNYAYNIIGAAVAQLPTEKMAGYAACALFKRMGGLFDAQPEEPCVAEFFTAAGLDVSHMSAEIMRHLPAIKLDHAGTDFYSYANVIKMRRVDINQKLNDQYLTAKRELRCAKEIGSTAVDNAKRVLREIFTDGTRGPIFAAQILDSRTGPCILARLDTCTAHLTEKMTAAARDAETQEAIAAARFDEAASAFIFTREARKNAYIEAKTAQYTALLARDAYSRMVDMYKQIRAALAEQHSQVFGTMADALTAVNHTLSTGTEAILSDTPHAYYHDIISIRDIAALIDNAAAAEAPEALTQDFAAQMLAHSDAWLGTNSSIHEFITDFVYNRFSQVLSASMSHLLATARGDTVSVSSLIENEVAPRLCRTAKPIFHLDNIAGMYNFPSYGVVSVPSGCPDILAGVEAYKHHALANLRINIRKSMVADRIFWLNTENGVPLAAYTPLRMYEEMYLQTRESREAIGRDIFPTTPSPLG
jgi:hypothetical protein